MNDQTVDTEEEEHHNMELWRGEVNTNLREMTKSLAEVSAVIGKLPTREEVISMLAQRVHVDVFRTEITAIQADIAALKSSPGKVRDWLSTGISAGVGCLSLCAAALSLLLSLLIATHVIH